MLIIYAYITDFRCMLCKIAADEDQNESHLRIPSIFLATRVHNDNYTTYS